MNFTDLAAVVGALAWLPPIFVGARSWLTRPVVRIITQPSPEIGFTTFGPILNLRVALTVTQRDLVITGIRLVVTHESGEQATFSWRGIVQRMGTMTYPEVGAVPFEKELNVLAMKVSPKDVEERFIRFQRLDYLKQKAELEEVAVKRMAFLQKTNSFDLPAFLQGSELADVYSFIRQSFTWKPGGYRMRIELEAPDAFRVVDDEYTFSLTPLHIQSLSENLDCIEASYAADLNSPPKGVKPVPVPWRWSYPDMQREQ